MDKICEVGLSSWTGLNQVITTLTEEQAVQMLQHEMDNRKRGTFVLRLNKRINALRSLRETNRLVKELTK
jgi:hypothetical protein